MKKFTSLVLAGTMLLSMPVTSFAKPEKKLVDYVVLGDSLAAGQTPYGQIDSGYGQYIAERFEQSQYTVNLDNYGVPGFTSTQLKKQLISNDSIKEAVRNAEIITIDIGANDALQALKAGNPMAALEKVQNNLDYILATIDAINPNVDVYVMGYYNPFPYLAKEQQESLMSLLDHLNIVIKEAANRNNDVYVPTEKVIAKHYQDYLPNPQDIHLSLEGYRIVAKEFWKAVMKNQN